MTPFQKIPEACKTTGLSMYYLRNGCKDGSVPHVKSGSTYWVNVPALLEKLGVPASAINKTLKRSEVDRFTGQAITNVGKNTPAQQRAVDEINAMFKNGKGKKPTTSAKKKR